MLKLFQVMLHNPVVSFLVLVAAAFVSSLIISDWRSRRLNRELLAARVRARTLYQHRRLQHAQLELEQPPLSPASDHLAEDLGLETTFKIFRWRWVVLFLVAAVVVSWVRNNEAFDQPRPAAKVQDHAGPIPAAPLPNPAANETAAAPVADVSPTVAGQTLQFDYDHADPWKNTGATEGYELLAQSGKVPVRGISQAPVSDLDSSAAANWFPGSANVTFVKAPAKAR